MGTRSCIGIETASGIRSIYCAFDGYLEGGVGQILVEYYSSPSAINSLLNRGDVYSLYESLNSTKFFKELKDYRLVSKDGFEAQEFASREEFFDNATFHDGAEYVYLFSANEWLFAKPSRPEFRSVHEALSEAGVSVTPGEQRVILPRSDWMALHYPQHAAA